LHLFCPPSSSARASMTSTSLRWASFTPENERRVQPRRSRSSRVLQLSLTPTSVGCGRPWIIGTVSTVSLPFNIAKTVETVGQITAVHAAQLKLDVNERPSNPSCNYHRVYFNSTATAILDFNV